MRPGDCSARAVERKPRRGRADPGGLSGRVGAGGPGGGEFPAVSAPDGGAAREAVGRGRYVTERRDQGHPPERAKAESWPSAFDTGTP